MKRRLMRVLGRTPRDRERELDEEIETHIALRAADLEAAGHSKEDARAQAVARFGDLEAARRELLAAAERRDRAAGFREAADSVRRDVSLALRRARTNPGHTMVTLGVFALGIGLTTVMFTIVDNVILRRLPFPEPERLVSLLSVPEDGPPFELVSMGNWYDWRNRARTLESTALYRQEDVGVMVGEDAVRMPVTTVSGAFFEGLGIPARVGRYFTEAEAREGVPLAVVSEALWRSALGARPDLSGQRIVVDGVDAAVVGVVPDGLEFPEGTSVWRQRASRAYTGGARNNINWRSFARLAEGVSAAQARAELDAVAQGIRFSDPDGRYSWGVGVDPLRSRVVGGAGRSLLTLMGAVLLVLLVACANLMGLGFTKARERVEEVAVRMSLGADRGRLLRQLITEQVLLAVAGGAVGLAVAAWGTRLVMGGLAEFVPRSHEVAFDLRILAVGFALSLVAGLVAGVGPAWKASRGDPGGVLKGTRTVRGGRGLPGASLVVAEIALTVVLLTGGGLLLRTMDVLLHRDLGFEPAGVVTLDMDLSTPTYWEDLDRVSAYWSNLVTVLGETPGILSVGAASYIPTGGGGTTALDLPGTGRVEGGAGYRAVSDGYFETLTIPLLAGRWFNDMDEAGSDRVAVVNEALAQKLWPGRSPVGERIRAPSMEEFFFGGDAPWITVVGVVGDVRHQGHEAAARPELFTLYRQVPGLSMNVAAVVKVSPGREASVLAAAQDAARRVDPGVAVQPGFLEGRVRDLMGGRRMVTSLLVTFAALALGLAAMGIYGVLAFAVSSRRREMAIRSALGAGRAGLMGMVVRSSLAVVTLGLAVGGLAAYIARGVLDSLLVDVGAGDPLTLVLVVGAIGVTGLLAAVIPGVRAARLDPLEAFREG